MESVRKTVIDLVAVAALMPIFAPGPAEAQAEVIETVLLLDHLYATEELPATELPEWLRQRNEADPDWLEKLKKRLGVEA